MRRAVLATFLNHGINFMFWSAVCSHLRAELFFSSLDVLYGGLGIKITNFLSKKFNSFSIFICNFFLNFWSSKPWIRIRIDLKCWIRIQIETNADPKHCILYTCIGTISNRENANHNYFFKELWSFFLGGFFGFSFYVRCFICRPSDSTVSEDAVIVPRTVAILALTARRSNHSARSHPLWSSVVEP